jgi:hypothetical protein
LIQLGSALVRPWARSLHAALSRGDQTAARTLLDSAPSDARPVALRRAASALALLAGDWRAATLLIRVNLQETPDSALGWQNLAATLAGGEQWALCRDAALRSVRLDPRRSGAWLNWMHAEAALALPANGAVLAQAVALHADDAEVMAAIVSRLDALQTHAPALAQAFFDIGFDAPVMRLAEARPELAEMGLRSASRAGDELAIVRFAHQIRTTQPDHPVARAAVLEVAVLNALYAEALDAGVPLLAGHPPIYVARLVMLALVETDDPQAQEVIAAHVSPDGTLAALDAFAARMAWPCPAPTMPQFAGFALLEAALNARRWRMCLAATHAVAKRLASALQAMLWVRVAVLLADADQHAVGLAAADVAMTLDPAMVSPQLLAMLSKGQIQDVE